MGNWISTLLDQQFADPDNNPGAAAAPVPRTTKPLAPTTGAQAVPDPATDAQDITIETGRFVPDGSPDAHNAQLASSAIAHTERFRAIVESFDEEKQTGLEWLVRHFFTALAYLLPPLVAFVVGDAIGDAFAGPFSLASWSLYAHIISVSLEMMLPVMGYSVTIIFKRAIKDRSQLAFFVFLSLVFLLLSVGNSFAQIFLIEKHLSIGKGDTVGEISVIFRSFGPLVIDVISTIYLAVATVKNLQKYLADQRAKIVAVRDVNQVNIEMEQTNIKAAIDRQTAVMDMESKQKRADTWNQIEAMQSQAMIEQARRNMQDRESGGSYRRSLY